MDTHTSAYIYFNKKKSCKAYSPTSMPYSFLPDGEPPMGTDQEPQGMLGGSNFSSNVKDKVQALLTQLPLLPGYSSMHKPGFVCPLEA